MLGLGLRVPGIRVWGLVPPPNIWRQDGSYVPVHIGMHDSSSRVRC